MIAQVTSRPATQLTAEPMCDVVAKPKAKIASDGPDDEEAEQERQGAEPRDEGVAALRGDHRPWRRRLAGECDDLTHELIIAFQARLSLNRTNVQFALYGV